MGTITLHRAGQSITVSDSDPKLLTYARLRLQRNVLLAESDWIGLSDTALTNEKAAEWKLYRQHLRNLPDGLDTVDKVKEVTWPEKPA